jgi:hypothetical protein
MLKKFAVTFAAIFVLALISSSLFAQTIPNVPLTADEIQNFLTVYANPDPTAVGTAAATQADPMKFASVTGKIQFIYQGKKQGMDDATIKTTSASSPLAVSDEDLAAYAADAEKITETLDKFMAAAMGAAQQ